MFFGVPFSLNPRYDPCGEATHQAAGRARSHGRFHGVGTSAEVTETGVIGRY